MLTYFSITRDSKHSLFSTNDLHRIQLGETLAEPGDFDLVSLHPSQLATMVVSPAKYGEGVSQWNAPVFRISVSEGVK